VDVMKPGHRTGSRGSDWSTDFGGFRITLQRTY
jgi:hypothetical protein